MGDTSGEMALQQLRAGGAAGFERWVAPLRPELRSFCYRLTGSVSDADDVVQESLVRAWKGLAEFEGRSSLRTWLYRIATHTCLTALESRRRREVPSDRGAPGEQPRPGDPSDVDVPWLEPCPSDLWTSVPASPEARLSSRESVAVAFLAALQHLPPQQRAVLVLREVLGWSAAEVAELLETSVAGVNSALQRARATLDARPAQGGSDRPLDSADETARSLLRRYIGAWESGDASALTQLLREDAVLTMPPIPAWYAGRGAITSFLGGIFSRMGPFRTLPVDVNGGAGVAMYMRSPDGAFRPQSVHALTADARGELAHVDVFMDPGSLASFALPPVLESGS